MAFGAALAFAVATPTYVLRRTYFGKALRALAYDREIAGAYGVDHRRIGMLTAGIGTAMGGVAGVLIGINQAVFPQLAFEWVGLIFAVVILGGIGNLLGAVGRGDPDRPRDEPSSASPGRRRERRSSSSCS